MLWLESDLNIGVLERGTRSNKCQDKIKLAPCGIEPFKNAVLSPDELLWKNA